MEIITGYVGKKHVTSEQERDVNQGIVGSGSYVLKTGMQMEAEVSSNNEIKIRDGVLMHQGCAASIKKNTYDSLTIINGSQGMKRIDLIVARYEKNRDDETESLNLEVIQGTPAESNPAVPEYTEGSIQAGDYIADMPMYQVIINGLNITEVKRLFEVEPDIDTLKKEFAELNGKMDKQKYKVGTVTLGYYDASYLYATMDLGTDQWNGCVIFTSMFAVRGTPYEQVASFSATQIQDNKVTIWARGGGFVNGHSLLVGYLIIPKN